MISRKRLHPLALQALTLLASLLPRGHLLAATTVAALTAALLVLVEVMKELPATALLRPLGGDTLAITVWEATKDSRFDVAALPALLIVAVGLVPVVLLVRLLRSNGWAEAAESI